MTFRRCVVLLFLGGLPGPMQAWAQTSAEDTARAREKFDRGEVYYRLGRFRDALTQYQQALELARRPSILFNIAQCHRQLGQSEKALFYYRLYLADAERERPGEAPPYRDEVQRHIDELERLLRARRAPSPGPTTTPAPVLRAPPASAAPPRSRRRGVLLGLGVGALVLTAGAEALALAFTVKANDEYSDTPQFSQYRGAAIGGHVAAGVFAAAAVLSWVLYLRSPQPSSGQASRWPGAGASFSF